MRKTIGTPSKEAVIKAINRVITVCFADEPEAEEVPGCCSMSILNGFPSDKAIEATSKQCLEEYIDGREEDDPKTNSGVMREILIDSLKKFLAEANGDCADLVILSEEQSDVQKLVREAGFERLGSYNGKEGNVTLYLRRNQ